MARVFSDLYHVFIRKQCILCSALRRKCCLTLLKLHYYMLPLFEVFPAPGTTTLLGCRLAASRFPCSLAIIANKTITTRILSGYAHLI